MSGGSWVQSPVWPSFLFNIEMRKTEVLAIPYFQNCNHDCREVLVVMCWLWLGLKALASVAASQGQAGLSWKNSNSDQLKAPWDEPWLDQLDQKSKFADEAWAGASVARRWVVLEVNLSLAWLLSWSGSSRWSSWAICQGKLMASPNLSCPCALPFLLSSFTITSPSFVLTCYNLAYQPHWWAYYALHPLEMHLSSIKEQHNLPKHLD